MKLISTKTHGVLDYLMGIFLIASPWIFGFAYRNAAHYVPEVVGIVMLLMSVMTNYELGMIKVVSMRVHLTIDFLNGLFLAVSPWLFGFSDVVYLPHLIIGIAEMGASLITDRRPYLNSQIA